jgi:hypothetical protein
MAYTYQVAVNPSLTHRSVALQIAICFSISAVMRNTNQTIHVQCG